MIKGYNKANIYDKLTWLFESEVDKNRSCVFLSHKKEDKPACREIANYLSNSGIDYFLDEEEELLQQAIDTGNPEKITEQIKKGIRESSHMLVVVSEKTYKSQWVPFEIGYGHAAIIDKSLEMNEREEKIGLSILTLKDIAEKELPTFMQVGKIIRGTKGLNEYLAQISNRLEKSMINERIMISASDMNHPLDNVLKWDL
jgi:hypothetical protein